MGEAGGAPKANGGAVNKRRVVLTVNDRDHEVWIMPSDTLLDVLHDELGMADVRYGCGEGVCGTCTVLLDGDPVNGCLTLAVQAEGHPVTTMRGLMGPGDALHPLQECFLRRGAAQCGFCTPGMVLTSLDLVAGLAGRPGTRSGTRWSATCAGAPATPRSSTPSRSTPTNDHPGSAAAHQALPDRGHLTRAPRLRGQGQGVAALRGRLAIVGYADGEKAPMVGTGKKRHAMDLAAQRAVNAKAYLVQQQGIDPSRVDVRSGTGQSEVADIVWVPQGANENDATNCAPLANTTQVDESVVTPSENAYPKPKKEAAPAHHHAAAGAQQ